MKTLRNIGLCLAVAMLALQAQVPPAPNTTARPTNAPAAPTGTLMNRSADFGRPKTNAVSSAAVQGATTVAAPAAGPAAAPANTPAVPTGRPAAVPALPGAARPAVAPPGGGPNLGTPPGGVAGAVGGGAAGATSGAIGSGGRTNVAATNIVARDATSIKANTIYFQEADLSQVLELYAELAQRTLLKSPQVPANVKISVRNQTELTRQEGLDALNTILALNGITMVPQGEKFIKVVPPTTLPTEAPEFSYQNYTNLPNAKYPVAQLVQLKNLLPEEATPLLQPFANLPNSIVGVKGSPVLILRDYAENVKRMLEILEKVDIYVAPEIDTVVIPIRYALAGEIASVLSGLSSGGSTTSFGSSGAGGGGAGFGGAGFGGGRGGLGGGMGGMGGGLGGGYGSGLGGGLGGSGYGGGSSYPGQTGVRGLGTSQGLGAGAGGAFGAGGRTPAGSAINRAVSGAVGRTGGGGAAGGDIQLIGQAKIIADERSNALLVFADKHDLTMISNIISKLDIVLPQVRIEALVLEVNLGEGMNVGVSMLQPKKDIGDLSVAGISPNGGRITDPGSISGIGSLATNLFNGGGFSYFAKYNDDFAVAVNAVANDNRINVLSRPSVVTSTARPAQIFVGETRPYVTGSTYGYVGAGVQSQVAQLQIGISLSVTPIINQEGLVVMDIAQDISQSGPDVMIDGNAVPSTINRNASSYIAVRDRDTIMLGGFISTTKRTSKGGVPYLKDIPGLGILFRSSADEVKRVELMVLIRPTVLQTPEVAALHTSETLDRLPNIRKTVREEEEFQQKQQEKERKDQEKFDKRNR